MALTKSTINRNIQIFEVTIHVLQPVVIVISSSTVRRIYQSIHRLSKLCYGACGTDSHMSRLDSCES